MENDMHAWDCALCLFGRINEIGMIHPEDLQIVNGIFVHCKLFRINRDDGEYLHLSYGNTCFRAKSEIVRVLGAICDLDVGDSVVISDGRVGEVKDIIWHYDMNEPFFILSINGKRRSKRYWREGLELREKFIKHQ